MKDVHVHFLHNATGEYTFELLERIVDAAIHSNMDEIYLLEHTHQFREFEKVFSPIDCYNEYQHNWLLTKMGGSIEKYLRFIELAKKKNYGIKIKYGLEVCYIPETVDLIDRVLKEYSFDFLTGAVHYIDNWGFDHKSEFWEGVNRDWAYKRYYEIMEELIETGIFNGLAHPDSIKCFGYYPSYPMEETYGRIADLLNQKGMYTEQSGGLALNYGFPELGLNQLLKRTFKEKKVKLMTASDAHKPEHAGKNILDLQREMRCENE